LVAKIKEKYKLNKEIETIFLTINKEVAKWNTTQN
jgi:hypothetical protein